MLGFELRPLGRPKKSVDVEELVSLYMSGKSIREIEKVTGVSRSTIWRRLHTYQEKMQAQS